jgi:Zn-dependent M28 family amino/carboxypeptidase
MTKINIFLIAFLMLFGNCVHPKKSAQTQSAVDIQLAETTEIITTLASDKFEGRKPGTRGFNAAAQYVEDYLKNNHIKPLFNNGYKDTVIHYGTTSYNIVGLIGDNNKTKKHILLGAHLDHLGTSRSTQDTVYNGANDDASGVTAVLQLGKFLNLKKYEDYNIIVALFTKEEDGLIGSKALAARLNAENINLTYVLNFEMIGKTLSSRANQVYITGFDKSNLAAQMNEVAHDKFAVFLPEEAAMNLFFRSDNYSFYETFKIPSHSISTFDFKNYNYYHETADEVKYLDLENMNAVIKKCATIINQFLTSKIEIHLQKKS